MSFAIFAKCSVAITFQIILLRNKVPLLFSYACWGSQWWVQFRNNKFLPNIVLGIVKALLNSRSLFKFMEVYLLFAGVYRNVAEVYLLIAYVCFVSCGSPFYNCVDVYLLVAGLHLLIVDVYFISCGSPFVNYLCLFC